MGVLLCNTDTGKDLFAVFFKFFLSFFNNLQKQLHFNVDITQQVGSVLNAAQKVLLAIGTTLFGVTVNFVLVLVIGFLWLVSSDRLKGFAVDLFPERHQELATDLFREVGYRMGGIVRASFQRRISEWPSANDRPPA